MLAAPSDHVIPDVDAFNSAVLTGLDAIKNGKIVTFGITPTHPETGYGYLELSKHTSGKAVDLLRFVEMLVTEGQSVYVPLGANRVQHTMLASQ